MCPPAYPQQDWREGVARHCLSTIRKSGGHGGCRCFVRELLLRGLLGEALVHEQAEVAGRTGGHAGAELVHEAERRTDFDGVCQILRIEGDLGRLTLGGDWHLEGRAHGVVFPVGQGEVARRFPSEAHGVRLAAQRSQPRDERGAVGFRDGDGFRQVAWNHLLVARIVAFDGFGDERVRTGAELDV